MCLCEFMARKENDLLSQFFNVEEDVDFYVELMAWMEGLHD